MSVQDIHRTAKYNKNNSNNNNKTIVKTITTTTKLILIRKEYSKTNHSKTSWKKSGILLNVIAHIKYNFDGCKMRAGPL